MPFRQLLLVIVEIHQLGRRDIQGFGHFADIDQRYIPVSPFHAPDIGAIQASFKRKGLLGVSPGLAQTAQVVAKPFLWTVHRAVSRISLKIHVTSLTFLSPRAISTINAAYEYHFKGVGHLGIKENDMKFLGNGVVFAIVYIIFMIPTYILPYLGSNSSLINAGTTAAGMGLSPAAICHLLSLLVLVVITWFRGAYVNQQWLVILPIIASLFDMVPGLSIVPFVPTVMHVFALVKGASESLSQELQAKE